MEGKKIKYKIWDKKKVYFLCAIALNLIEFFRATGNGDVWKTAANCTGLVIISIIVCTCGIKNFLNTINYVWSFICILIMIGGRFHWERHIGEYSFGQMETAILNIWGIGLIIHYFFCKMIADKEKKVQISLMGYLWTGAVVWTIVGVSGKIWPLWFYVIFGGFYLIDFREKDWGELWNAIINGTIFSFFIIQGYAYLFRPYDMVRYNGAFSNCNMMGLYYAIVYVMVLCKLHQLHLQKAKTGWKLFYFIGAGGLQGFMFITLSRTAWMASIVITLFYGIFVLRKLWGETWRKLILRGCTFVLCIVITFPAVYLTVRYLPTIHPHPIWYEGEYSVTRVHPWDPADSEKYISMEELMEEAFGRFITLILGTRVKDPLVLKVHAQEPNNELEPIVVPTLNIPWLDSSTRVRFSAARTYLKNSTWLGHTDSEENFIWESTGNRVWHSQNFWVQMTYTFGYPAGVLALLLTILLFLKTYQTSKREIRACNILPVLICLLFIVYGMVDIVWNAGQLIFTLVFMVAHPQFSREEEMLKNRK